MKTAQEFIDFFEAIPEEKWCMGQYVDMYGRHCALGHLGCGYGLTRLDSPEVAALRLLFNAAVTVINDGEYKGEPTPKKRVLRALRDAKEAGR